MQEAEKYDLRLPRAAAFVKEGVINKIYNPDPDGRVGIITHSILTNIVLTSLASLGIKCPVYPLYCLYPIVESEIVEFLKIRRRF
jgi:TPP-dependent indolepyruvate ferredoxin oxidoreductase alpha subunit